MPGHRFFIPKENFTAQSALVSGDEAHHLRKVLRLEVDEQIQVFDGEGQEWLATIKGFSGQTVSLQLEEQITTIVESPLEITLVQGLIKGDRFDWAIQKSVELGVSHIQPLVSRYSDIQLAKGQGEKRLERWERIALEASKQSGRRKLTTILSPLEWSKFISQKLSCPTIFFAERGGASLSQIIAEIKNNSPKSINLVVGSEGGWSSEELEQAKNVGYHLTTLGRRILRAETAGITAVGLIQHLLGDLD
jgi:16S rRNA (uracil1498-N3)-methyltransferase